MALQLRSPDPMRTANVQRNSARYANAGAIGFSSAAAGVVRRIMSDPELRGRSAQEVATRIGRGVDLVRQAFGLVAEQARRAAGDTRVSLAQIVGRVTPDMTLDDVLARFGSRAAPPATSPSPTYVLRPSILNECLRCVPHARHSPYVQRMIRVGGRGEAMGFGGDAGKITLAPPGSTASSPSTQWSHTVQPGENPSQITKERTGDDRRYVELIDANPSKPTVGDRLNPYSTGFNFKSLMAGEVLDLPKSWNIYVNDAGQWSPGVPLPAGKPAPTPSPAPGPTGVYSSTLPAGAITAIKLQLGAWGKKEGTSSYPGPFDVNEVIDEAFRTAVAGFQKWWNANRGGSLRTDGSLDKGTHDAINAYSVGMGTTTSPGGTSTPGPGLPPPFGGKPSTPATPGGGGPIATTGSKERVGGSEGPLIALAALAAWKAFG